MEGHTHNSEHQLGDRWSNSYQREQWLKTGGAAVEGCGRDLLMSWIWGMTARKVSKIVSKFIVVFWHNRVSIYCKTQEESMYLFLGGMDIRISALEMPVEKLTGEVWRRSLKTWRC